MNVFKLMNVFNNLQLEIFLHSYSAIYPAHEFLVFDPNPFTW